MSEFDIEALGDQLSEFAPVEKKEGRPAREERVIAGFEDIQRFVEEHGHLPQHGEDRDIFERIYAVRLDRLRALEDGRSILAEFDTTGILVGSQIQSAPFSMTDDELLAELSEGVEASGITQLTHVRSYGQKRAAPEAVASTEPCRDFERFRPLFEKVAADLKSGERITQRIRKQAGFRKAIIQPGEFFILDGQMAYVADIGDPINAPNGETDARLRVIYGNGTESNLLQRSLQRAFYDDETSRMVSEPTAGPLFGSVAEQDDVASGTIYVLRSKSDHPYIQAHHDLIHKIGFTRGEVDRRIAKAKLDSTFLMAEVEVVETFQLYNISHAKFEALIHRLFDNARLAVAVPDRFGNSINPREWFQVPLFIIEEAIDKIRDGSIVNYVYDPDQAALLLIRQ